MPLFRSAALALVVSTLFVPHAGWADEYERLEVRFESSSAPPPALEALLRQLMVAALERDLAVVARHVGSQFFWEQDFGGGFDSSASALNNLATALSLDDSKLLPEYQGWGWERLSLLLGARTMMAHVDRQNVICLPGAPALSDEAAAEEVFQRTGTDKVFDWGFVETEPVPVWQSPEGAQPPIGMLNSEAVLVVQWHAAPQLNNTWQADRWAEVRLPDGRGGYVDRRLLWSWSPERLCFGADRDGAWNIVGYMGGGD